MQLKFFLTLHSTGAGEPVDAGAAAKAASLPALERILQGARLIEHTEGCRVFEPHWDSYIAYSVRNESFVANDKYEQLEGRLLVKCLKSRFLDYVALGTFASDDYPGSFRHWGVVCGDHVIDIASMEEPKVRVVLSDGA